MQCIFFNTTFLQFWAFFTNVYNHFGKRSYGNLFLLQVYILERTLFFIQKKFWFGYHAILPLKYCICRKTWTLVNCISWCLTDHTTIWTKFVNGNGGLSEYLISGMWSFGHLCVFGCKNVRRLCFFFCDFEAWPLVLPTISQDLLLFFHCTSPPRTQKPEQTHVICWTP